MNRIGFVLLSIGTLAGACSATNGQILPEVARTNESRLSCSAPQTATADIVTRSELVASVHEDRDWQLRGHSVVPVLRGADVVIRPDTQLSRPLLVQAVQCRMWESAESAAMAETDPLAIDHIEARVAETDTGYIVEITSRDEMRAKEVVRRARNLLAHAVVVSNQAPGQLALARW